MTVRLYDTLSRETKELLPFDGKELRLYCCGPTVYGPAHIGNFRTFLVQDVLRRTLETLGTPVRHVRNLTDVDDKTIRQSQAQGKSLAEFTAYWRDRFHLDCRALGLLPPHVEPGAVDHIPHQIRMIGQLIERGHAYAAMDGSVYFKVESYGDYGKLSRLKEREVITGASGARSVEDADEYVRDSAADFALWKARKPEDGANFWPSPWGEGRPGWHLECSAMAHEYLGHDIDLHSGGIDLVFPHHENEIAQSECATGCGFVRHWFHIAHLTVDRQKMSKSLGNLYTLEDVKARGYTATELRYVLVSGHYHKPLNFTWESLDAARSALNGLRKLRAKLPVSVPKVSMESCFTPVFEALADDLNVPKALGQLFTVVAALEKRLPEGLPESELALEAGAFAAVLQALGIDLTEEAQASAAVPAEIQALAEERWQARQSKNWAESDRLRDELKAKGWLVKDAKTSYELTPLT